MELFEEIFTHAIVSGKMQVSFRGMENTATEVMDGVCYQAIAKIKAIIQDDSVSDRECFAKIEEIVCSLEEIGINCGSRHDFG